MERSYCHFSLPDTKETTHYFVYLNSTHIYYQVLIDTRVRTPLLSAATDAPTYLFTQMIFTYKIQEYFYGSMTETGIKVTHDRKPRLTVF